MRVRYTLWGAGNAGRMDTQLACRGPATLVPSDWPRAPPCSSPLLEHRLRGQEGPAAPPRPRPRALLAADAAVAPIKGTGKNM